MFPHIASKFADIGTLTLNKGTLGFFAKAGMVPAEFWVYLAAASELTVGIFLVLGLCTRYPLGAAALLAVAVHALQVVKGFGWTWNTGGYEYPVFWALVCIASEEWKTYLAGSPRSGEHRRHGAARGLKSRPSGEAERRCAYRRRYGLYHHFVSLTSASHGRSGFARPN